MSSRHRGRRSALPAPVLALAIVAIAFFALPLIGLLWRAPWSSAWSYLTDDDALTALRLSLVCSLWATGLSIVFGVPLAWLLARVEFRGRGAVRALCTLSMVLPPVVGGVALFFALGRRGHRRSVPRPVVRLPVAVHHRGRRRRPDVRGDAVPRDHRRGVLAPDGHAVRGCLANARRLAVVHVPARDVPAIGPALGAGAVLAWARALGEFGATITFAGNFPGTTQTMPLAVYLSLETNPEEAICCSILS